MHLLDRQQLNEGWVLTSTYGESRMVLLPRDPYWLFTYWEVTPSLEEKMNANYGRSWSEGRTVLRIYDEDTGILKEVDLSQLTDNWHINVDHAGHSYRVSLGRIIPGRGFIPILTSNTVRTPRDSISSVIDPHWKMFAFWQFRFYKRMLLGLSSYELFDQDNRLNIKEVDRN